MTKLTNVVRQLQQARARTAKELQRLDAALAALNGSNAKYSWSGPCHWSRS
jgi:hypothetical protein